MTKHTTATSEQSRNEVGIGSQPFIKSGRKTIRITTMVRIRPSTDFAPVRPPTAIVTRTNMPSIRKTMGVRLYSYTVAVWSPFA